MCCPCRFGGGGCRNVGEIAFAHIPNRVADPFDVLLEAAGHIAETGRVLRAATHDKHIRKADALHAKEGTRCFGPFIL